jgi:hypothetical protein
MLEEIMMKKLIVLLLALTIATPALAEDLVPAPFRGQEGSTYSHWTYDDPCNVYYGDAPDSYWIVSHPLKEDPWREDPCDPCSPFSMQWWGSNGDPCAPAWYLTFAGRSGVVDFAYGSWDINNFIHDQPAKDLWVQVTYFNGTSTPTEFGFLAGYVGGDVAQGWWEGLLDPCDPCSFAEHEGPLAEWPTWAGDPLDTWYGDFIDGERLSSQVVTGGWLHDVWQVQLPLNPEWEWFEGGWAGNVMIDQIVIETLCYVPEPATMVLLGLGSLLMIRRKRR